MSIITNLLGGLAFGSLLFLVAAGFTQILGLMQIINAAQTAFYLVGAYVGISIAAQGVDFWLSAVVATVVVAVMGTVIYQLFLKRNRLDHVTTLFVTIGFSIILGDGALAIWGGDPKTVSAPSLLEGSVSILGEVVPLYWVSLIVIGMVIAVALFLIERKTVIGAILRAGVDDGEMVSGLGINVDRVFILVFAMGSGLAGLAGMLGGPITGAYTGLDLELIPLAFAVVILGGMGSLVGTLVGSIAIGVVNNLGIAFFPQFSYFTIFAPVALILAIKPQGLFGRKERVV